MGKQFEAITKVITRAIIDIVYPRSTKCILCKEDDVDGICTKCFRDITFCDNSDELCVGYYKGTLKKLILRLKCNNDFEAGEILIELAKEKLKQLDEDYYLTYIPVSKSTLKHRGFNQCEYIAKELAYRNNFRYINTLKRVKEVKIQKTLDKQQRYNNLYKAFDAIDKSIISGRKFVLIDDVKTTGSTLNEGIRVLRENGAISIKTLTLAKSFI